MLFYMFNFCMYLVEKGIKLFFLPLSPLGEAGNTSAICLLGQVSQSFSNILLCKQDTVYN